MEGKRKVKANTVVSLLSPKTLILAHDRSSEADILIWNRRAKCTTCTNGFLVRSSSLSPSSEQESARLCLASKHVFRQNSQVGWVNPEVFEGFVLVSQKHCHLVY